MLLQQTKFLSHRIYSEFKTMNSSRRESRLQVGMAGAVPQHTGHEVVIMKPSCCQSVGSDAWLLCQRMGPGSAPRCVHPQSWPGLQEHLEQAKKRWRRAGDVV